MYHVGIDYVASSNAWHLRIRVVSSDASDRIGPTGWIDPPLETVPDRGETPHTRIRVSVGSRGHMTIVLVISMIHCLVSHVTI